MENALVIAVVWTLVAVVRLALFLRRRSLAGRVAAFARTVDLAPDEGIIGTVGARLRNREVVGSLAGLATAWPVVLLLAADRPTGWESYAPMLVIVAYFAGHALGYGVVAWLESARRTPRGPRIARASSPTHGDYVARHERASAWVVAGISTAVSVAVALAAGAGVLGATPSPGLLVAAAVVPWVLVAADELLARRLLQRPQVARTTLELAWDDALRARTLRDLVTVPIVVGYLAPLALIGYVADRVEGGWPANPMVGVTSGAFALLLVAGLVMAVVSLILNPQRHFRRRLWGPAPVPAQVGAALAAQASTGAGPGR